MAIEIKMMLERLAGEETEVAEMSDAVVVKIMAEDTMNAEVMDTTGTRTGTYQTRLEAPQPPTHTTVVAPVLLMIINSPLPHLPINSLSKHTSKPNPRLSMAIIMADIRPSNTLSYPNNPNNPNNPSNPYSPCISNCHSNIKHNLLHKHNQASSTKMLGSLRCLPHHPQCPNFLKGPM